MLSHPKCVWFPFFLVSVRQDFEILWKKQLPFPTIATLIIIIIGKLAPFFRSLFCQLQSQHSLFSPTSKTPSLPPSLSLSRWQAIPNIDNAPPWLAQYQNQKPLWPNEYLWKHFFQKTERGACMLWFVTDILSLSFSSCVSWLLTAGGPSTVPPRNVGRKRRQDRAPFAFIATDKKECLCLHTSFFFL